MIGRITFSKVQDPSKWDIPDSIEFPSAEAARAAEETVNKAIVEAYEQGRIKGLKEAVEILRQSINKHVDAMATADTIASNIFNKIAEIEEGK